MIDIPRRSAVLRAVGIDGGSRVGARVLVASVPPRSVEGGARGRQGGARGALPRHLQRVRGAPV